MNPELKRLVETRLEQASLSDEAGPLVLEALRGGAALDTAVGADKPGASVPPTGADAAPEPARGALAPSGA